MPIGPQPLSLAAALTALAVGLPGDARAGAFQLREGSAAAQGMSLAGRASHARDVSFALGNPANLRGVQGLESSTGLAGVFARSRATADGTAIPGTRLRDDAGEPGLVPSFALGYRLNERVVLGLTVDSPFGLSSSYRADFAGAFDAVDSALLTIAVTPMIAVQPMPHLTIGAGLSVLYADARLSNQTLGGVAEISGDDIALGFVLGATIDPVPGTSLGIRYRSGFDLSLRGRFSDNFVIPVDGVPGGLNLGGPGRAETSLPASVNFGFTHAVTDRWRVLGEAEWTRWSVYDTIRITSDATGVVIDDVQNYRNSWMAAIGAEFDWSNRLTLRSGVAFDGTPTRDAFRTARVPDGDQFWMSVGVSYAFTPRFGVDLAYTYLFVPDSPTVTLRSGPNAGRRVTFDNDIHAIGINARLRF